MIDLRSDTITRPTKPMLEAMFNAKVGDDVLQDDPTVNALEEKAATLFNKPAAVYCPSGTMTNQIAIKAHTKPGDEIICDQSSHIYNFEGGGLALNSGCSVRLIQGNRGRFTAQDVLENINNPHDVHLAMTKVVAVENTCNKGGGSFYNFKELEKIAQVCKSHKLFYHIDGARLFNALVETDENPAQYGALFDSISICLSKGLGAPVGSLLLGNKDFINETRRYRRSFGGGMRQAGYLAAAGIYALDNHIERLTDDHKRAKIIGNELASLAYVKEVLPVDTNIVIFRLDDKKESKDFLNQLKNQGILMIGFGHQTIRAVTHLDFNDDDLEQVIKTLKKTE